VDRAAFPRWKVCGACLNPAVLAYLSQAGLGDLTERCAAVPVSALRLTVRRRQADIGLPGWRALSRERFDAALVEAAVAVGAIFLTRTQASLGSAQVDSRPVILHQDDVQAQAKARLVLAADGLGGRLLADATENVTHSTPTSRIGAGVVADDAPDYYESGKIFMAYGTGGYVGLVRLEDGRLNIAAAFDPTFLKETHSPGVAAARLLDEVGWPAVPDLRDLHWRGTPTLTRQAARPASERILAIGDATGYVEPFTGEGIGWALASALSVVPVAVRVIQQWQPRIADEWTEMQRQTRRRRQGLCRAVTWVSRHPILTNTLVGIVSLMPRLAAPLVHRIQSSVQP
jgi:flavin-dependent dehydrogenase